MIEKIFGYLIAGIVAMFGILFGTERGRRKRAEKQRDAAISESIVSKAEKSAAESVAVSTSSVSEKIEKVNRKTEELKHDEKTSYNDVVDSFNSSK